VPGSGLNGRITKQDLLDFLAARKQSISAAPMPALPANQGSLLPLTPMRRRIAERMLASVQTAPHVLTVMEADLSRVLGHLEHNKARFAADGIRLTLTAYFIEAIARALRAYPLVNSSWTDAGIQLQRQINIGMAVSLGDDGLIVPVIRDADLLSLSGIARAVNTLAERARANQLTPDEVRGGTISLTNHGTGKSLFATPIITLPQTGILGTGALHKRPIVITDELGRDSIAIRPMIYLSFVFDHRILDGAAADGFLSHIKTSLEAYH
jgi:2-oxoglutarate dehydrogenase E2 component (dihydrolipoamide succinyltransferase)